MGAVVIAVGDGVSALLVEARWAAEPEPALELGVWAEAVAAPASRAAAKKKVFIKCSVKK